MGLRKKGSRLIVVGGKSYRWTVSNSTQAETGCLSVVVQSVDRPSQRIVARTACRDFWLDFSDLRDNPIGDLENEYKPVKPARVRKIIEAALAQGWSAEQPRKQLVEVF